MKKRLLITGANGMLGATLVKLYQEKYNVFATGSQLKSLSFAENYKSFNLKEENYGELISWSNPDVIIHCAALTNGNYCEENPLEAIEVNSISLRKFIKSVKEKTKIIYISSDAVFSSLISLASEENCTEPESVYGKSKEIGEFFLLNSNRDFTIVRTTIVGLNFNKSKESFVEWIIKSAKKGVSISLFNDVMFNPISIWDLAYHLEKLFSVNGIFSRKAVHIAGKQVISKYQFGIELLKSLELPTDLVEKGKIINMTGRAKRSTDQSLDCKYFNSMTSESLPDLQETINSIQKNLKSYENNQIGE